MDLATLHLRLSAKCGSTDAKELTAAHDDIGRALQDMESTVCARMHGA